MWSFGWVIFLEAWPKTNPTDSPRVEPMDDAIATNNGLYNDPPTPVAKNPGTGKKRVDEEIKFRSATPIIPSDVKVLRSNLK